VCNKHAAKFFRMLVDVDIQLHKHAELYIFGTNDKMMVLVIGEDCSINEAIAGP
jgi:hypothetical protein